jgi:hypothetical protein
MHVTIHLRREHLFQNQIRRNFSFRSGAPLAGDLRLFPSTWPFGVCHHEDAGSLGVEFTFSYEDKLWLYRGFIDCRRLWPAPGSTVRLPSEADHFPVGPLLGMRDGREDYHYILPDGSERSFRLKYIGFECWVTCQDDVLLVKLRHFVPGDDYVLICHSLPVEDVLFQKERKLSYDTEGFLEDAYDSRPFVRVEECSR